MSVNNNEDLIIICEESKSGQAVSYIRIFGSNLFVSWEDGWLGVYAIQNICSYLEMVRVNRGEK